MVRPTMPAPIAGGEWSNQPLTASEGSVWLREIISPFTPDALPNIATHSAKATIFSWMSKANVELSVRRLAGYHTAPGDKSALEYSRDAASPILREIEAILISIRAEFFFSRCSAFKSMAGCSDSYRCCQTCFFEVFIWFSSAWSQSLWTIFICLPWDWTWRPVHGRCTWGWTRGRGTWPARTLLWSRHRVWACFQWWHDFGRTQVYNAENLSNRCLFPDTCADSDISDISSDDSSSVDDDCDSVELERQAELDGESNARDLVAPSDLAGKTCVRHVKSKKLHFIEKVRGDQNFFRCGRRCNANYEHVETVPAFAAHGCMMCFGWSTSRDSSDSGEWCLSKPEQRSQLNPASKCAGWVLCMFNFFGARCRFVVIAFMSNDFISNIHMSVIAVCVCLARVNIRSHVPQSFMCSDVCCFFFRTAGGLSRDNVHFHAGQMCPLKLRVEQQQCQVFESAVHSFSVMSVAFFFSVSFTQFAKPSYSCDVLCRQWSGL